MISLEYGKLPKRHQFYKEIQKYIPYSQRFTGNAAETFERAIPEISLMETETSLDRTLVLLDCRGANRHLDRVDFKWFDAGCILGVEIIADYSDSLHALLRRLIETEKEEYLNLAHSIMQTLGYEWI